MHERKGKVMTSQLQEVEEQLGHLLNTRVSKQAKMIVKIFD